jgi:hypothetical protein
VRRVVGDLELDLLHHLLLSHTLEYWTVPLFPSPPSICFFGYFLLWTHVSIVRIFNASKGTGVESCWGTGVRGGDAIIAIWSDKNREDAADASYPICLLLGLTRPLLPPPSYKARLPAPAIPFRFRCRAPSLPPSYWPSSAPSPPHRPPPPPPRHRLAVPPPPPPRACAVVARDSRLVVLP